MLPSGDSTFREMRQKDINKAADHVDPLLNALSKDKLNQMEGVYIKGKWNFTYNKNKLEIASSDSQNSGVWIFVERKDTNDNKVEAVYYTTKTIIDRIDLTDKINSPKLALEGDRLNIIKAEPYEIKLIKYQKEFTVTQFSLEKDMESQEKPSNVMGSRIIYLKIPKDIQLIFDSNKVNIQYVK